MVGDHLFRWEQGQLGGSLVAFIEGLDDPTPSLSLTVIDLAEIEDLLLHDFAAGAALAFDHIPIDVLFAVLEATISF